MFYRIYKNRDLSTFFALVALLQKKKKNGAIQHLYFVGATANPQEEFPQKTKKFRFKMDIFAHCGSYIAMLTIFG